MAEPTPPRSYSKDDIRRFERNYREEVDGAALYEVLAAAERNPALRELYGKLAATETRHKDLWAQKLREAGAPVPSVSASRKVRFIGWVARRFGPDTVAPFVTRMEAGATAMYDTQPEAIEHNLPADERSHARIFREIGRSSRVVSAAGAIARIEGRHRFATSGNALRAAVLGANDGLVSNLALVMAVAGANPGRDVVILAGFAGLLGGAISMALGEWISVQSSREAFESQLAVERDELELIPDEEEAELALIYQAKGLSAEEAQLAAARIIADPAVALDTLAREELGMAAGEIGDPWVAAITSFITFGAGASLPLIPWLFLDGVAGVAASAGFSAAGLFAVGAAITLFTGLRPGFSGLRMLVFGMTAAIVTFAAGYLVGAGAGISS
ncbi:MAG: VIT1/CCC1 family protein [Dehalococcoidia bacterium]